MKSPVAVAVLVGLAFAAEGLAGWWMSPGSRADSKPVLEWDAGDGDWDVRYDVLQEIQTPLRCTGGWVGDTTVSETPVRISFIRWDETSNANTLEAFKHMPEVCMGSIGMDLEEIHPRRLLEIDGRTLYFDSTRFRPTGGGPAVHVFKCIWVGGREDVDLRGGLGGNSIDELRQFRLTIAATRFRPAHTRVVMGGISGLPSEALAWNEFRKLVEPHLIWSQSAP